MKRKGRNRLKASALFYALVLSVLVMLICGTLIAHSYYHNILIKVTEEPSELRSNIRSARALVNSGVETIDPNSKRSINLFEDEDAEVEVQRLTWGLFDKIGYKASCQRDSIEKWYFTVSQTLPSSRIALHIRDNNRKLGITGGTYIEGNVRISKMGIERSYMEGRSYSGKQMVYGTISNSEVRFPELPFETQNRVADYALQRPNEFDSILVNIDFSKPIINHNHDKNLIIQLYDSLHLDAVTIKGSVVIKSNNAVSIGRNAEMEGVIICAPSVYFEDDCQLSVQVFAQERIIVGKNSSFEYPSALVLQNDALENGGEILIKQSSNLRGWLVTLGKEAHRSLVKIEENAEIDGQIYSFGKCEVRGSVSGSLWTREIYLKTPSAIYKEKLMDATISYSAQHDLFEGDLWSTEEWIEIQDL